MDISSPKFDDNASPKFDDDASPKFDDSSSLSNPDSFLVSHISLNWNVDFEKRKVFGSAKLTVLQKKTGANELHLDSRNLAIHRVFNATTGASLDFAIEPHPYCDLIGQRINIKLPDASAKQWMIVIEYSTSPDAQALSWLLPEKTVGKKFPYVFSHCQAIYARTLLPCQDTPFVKVTYDASVKVPKDLTALMSALFVSSVEEVDDGRTFLFEQKESIPSYLIALAVGALESRDVGPRTRVWSEAEEVDAAASQFAETEKYIEEATIRMHYEEYVWRRCDLLILPPSISYAGMENPCVIFVTPTLLAGDRPLVDVIAQGISHYCTDNLLLSTSRKHFWRSQSSGGSLQPAKDTSERQLQYVEVPRVHVCFGSRYRPDTFRRPPMDAVEVPVKVIKLACGDSLKQKVQYLPWLCVQSICQFASTSKLVRLYSNAVPLPGPFWSYAVNAVLRKRLPLSLRDDLPFHQADDVSAPQALFDAAGAKVASVKHPEAFPFSPLCEFIATAAFTGRVMPIDCPQPQLQVVNGQTLLSLTQLTELTLLLRDYGDVYCRAKQPHVVYQTQQREDSSRHLLAPNLKHLLPQLQSLAFVSCNFRPANVLDLAVAGFLREMPLHEMTALRRLIMPEFAFTGVMENRQNQQASGSRVRMVLSGLRCLSIWQRGAIFMNPRTTAMLRFLRQCPQLSSLFLRVEFNFNVYLAAFRALSSLSTLGMYLEREISFVGATLTDEAERVTSVLDLRFICSADDSRVATIAKLFPNATAVAFQAIDSSGYGSDALTLASEFCAKRVLPALATLSCYHLSTSTFPRLAQFIGHPGLPHCIDLSQVLFESLMYKPGLLTAIYKEMQENLSTSLLLRGPLHREALPRLQSHIKLNGGNAKVAAWEDQDLGEQPGLYDGTDLSEQTDFKIVGLKTWGKMAGEKFTIRVFHQFSSRTCIFD